LSGLLVNAQKFPMLPMSNGRPLLVEKGSTLHITAEKVGNIINFGGGSAGNADVDGQPGRPAPPGQNWPLPDAPSFAFLAKVGPEFHLVQRDNTFEAKEEGELSLWFNDAAPLDDNNGFATATVSVTAPAKAGPTDSEKVPVDSLSPKDADKMKEAFLLKHLNANAVYYDRAVWVLMDAAERRLYLEATLGSNSSILAAIDDKPIAVSGNHVAFIYEGPLPFTPWAGSVLEPLEAIVTLPTRGLFAEAQLGHCNSCEMRDVTRMWDWTEMTAEEPPAITGIEPGPRGQMPNITPTSLPANVIQIAPTPAAPDPVGLAAALKLLGTPNIFRDMSGLDEASTILGKLVDGTTTTLAEMVKGAAAAKQKVDATRAEQNASSNGQSSKKQTPTERYDNLQVAKEVAQAADQLGLNDQQKSELAQRILGSESGAGSLEDKLAVTIDLAKYCTPSIRAFSPNDTTGVTTLRAVVTNAPAGSTWRWTVASPTAARIVSPRAYITEVIAGDPGLTDVTFEARDPGGVSLGTSTVRLSVPQFVVIDEEAAAFNAQLVIYQLDDVKATLLLRLKGVLEFLMSRANVRLIWRLPPFNEPLPAHIAPGGFATGKFNLLTIRGVNAGKPDAAGKTEPGGPADFDELIDIWPAAFRLNSMDVGADVATVVANITAMNMTDPDVKIAWTEIMARLLGETMAHEIHHALLGGWAGLLDGHNSPAIAYDLMNQGRDRGWFQRTGIEIRDPANFPKPGSYRDDGLTAMGTVQPTNQAKVDSVFPIPPAFL
jgi:hypothetical protein